MAPRLPQVTTKKATLMHSSAADVESTKNRPKNRAQIRPDLTMLFPQVAAFRIQFAYTRYVSRTQAKRKTRVDELDSTAGRLFDALERAQKDSGLDTIEDPWERESIICNMLEFDLFQRAQQLMNDLQCALEKMTSRWKRITLLSTNIRATVRKRRWVVSHHMQLDPC